MARKRILFIDSDDGFVRDVASAAQKQGFEASVTGSSSEGVDKAREERPDLIVVSVELAPTNGWSVCTKLKKDDDLKDIPVILTSSLSTPDTFEKHKKLKTRADEYLIKPYSADDLVRIATELVGAPDPADLQGSDEDVVVEDESLSAGDFDMSGLDEEIPVLGDEPLVDGLEASLGADLEGIPGEATFETGLDASLDSGLEPSLNPRFEASLGASLDASLSSGLEASLDSDEEASLEALPTTEESLLDPLAVTPDSADLPEADELGDLSSDLGDLSAELGAESDLPAADDFASFDDSFASLAANEESPAQAEASLEESSFEEFSADLASPEAAAEASFDSNAVDAFPAEAEAVEAAAVESDSPFSAEEFSFDEAPLEVPSEAGGASLEANLSTESHEEGEDFAAQLGETAQFNEDPLSAATDFSDSESFVSSLTGDFGDSAKSAELEARVAELEAELEGYKTTENTHDQELERLRKESSQRARETQELRDQLREQEKAIHDLKETESRLNSELTKAKDERVRREAAMKAFTQKAEQMSVQSKRLEREVLTAREELKNAAALKTRVTELEGAQKKAEADAETFRQQLEALRAELEAARATIETTQSEKSFIEAQLTDAKEALERAESEKADLAAQATTAETKAASLEAQAKSANDRAVRAREALRAAVEHLGQEVELTPA
jgi:ActR/RegA family two-component response regulator